MTPVTPARSGNPTTSLPSRKRTKKNEAYPLVAEDDEKCDEESIPQPQDGEDEESESEYSCLKRAVARSTPPDFSTDGSPSRGGGVRKFEIAGEVGSVHFQSLVKLHDKIRIIVKKAVPWGEASPDIDPRRRCYAFLPDQRQRLVDLGIKVQRQGSKGTSEHDETMSNASIDLCLKDDPKTHEALKAVTVHIHSLAPKNVKKFVTMKNLVVVQPNLHNGALHLPAHLDFPRADGFGVVIATIAIRHTAGSKVVLVDDGDDGENSLYWSFNLKDGDCYVLSGDSRNKCLHGIIAKDGRRETLNLRYGLHSEDFAREEVDCHWPDA